MATEEPNPNYKKIALAMHPHQESLDGVLVILINKDRYVKDTEFKTRWLKWIKWKPDEYYHIIKKNAKYPKMTWMERGNISSNDVIILDEGKTSEIIEKAYSKYLIERKGENPNLHLSMPLPQLIKDYHYLEDRIKEAETLEHGFGSL